MEAHASSSPTVERNRADGLKRIANELDIQQEIAMKKLVFALSALGALAAGTVALAEQKMDDMKSMDMKNMDMGKKGAGGAQATHHAKATVKAVDPEGGSVTLVHEPIKTLNWSSMTMAFKVKDKALFDKLTVGNQVQVDIVQEGKDYVVTAVK